MKSKYFNADRLGPYERTRRMTYCSYCNNLCELSHLVLMLADSGFFLTTSCFFKLETTYVGKTHYQGEGDSSGIGIPSFFKIYTAASNESTYEDRSVERHRKS